MPTSSCTRNCWIAGAVLGLLVFIFTAGTGPLRWFEGLFLGLVAAALFGVFLDWLICRGEPARDGSEWHPDSAAASATTISESRPRGVASEAAVGFLGGAENDLDDPVTPGGHAQVPTTGQRSESQRNDIYGNAGTKTKAQDAEQVSKPASQPADPTASDDLKKIKGVGPKLEETLHEHGVTRFAQIAAWDDAEIDRFAEIIGRMGSRIRSDDWVDQARILARDGETEFSKRVEEGDVY